VKALLAAFALALGAPAAAAQTYPERPVRIVVGFPAGAAGAYQGSSPAVTDLLAGRTQIMFSAVSVVLPHIKAGTLKALAWAAPKRSAVLPDIPTVAEVGLPELDASIWFGLMAPAGTPGDVLDRLARALNDGLKSEALRGALDKMGYEPLGGTPDDFTHYVAAELKKWTAAADAAGVRK
jgi:tripartite-type tricarboxylate transporter receptor subunit TctC